MDPYKLQRQNAAIRKVLAEVLAQDVKDPRVGFVSVNGVELNRDQTVARVFISVIGDDDARLDSMRGLKKARGFLQGRLGDILRMRATPDLRFEYDDSLDRSLGVDDILDQLEQKGEFTDEATRRRSRTFDSLEPPHDLMTKLRRAESIWVVPHANPDPDATGSALALAEALRVLGKEAVAVGYPEPPLAFRALPGSDETLSSEAVLEASADDLPDLLVLVDCHHRSRTGDLEDALAGIPDAWCVDHHLADGGPAPLPGWIDAVAGSCSLLVQRVIEDLDVHLTSDMAANLYAGLYTDTGGFRHPNTLPLCFEAAQRLAAAGADVAQVAELTLHVRPRRAVDLMTRVMETFEYHAGGKILTLHADQAMLEETGAVLSDTEHFTGFATGVDGVRYVVFLKERADGAWRVSLRAHQGGDVQSVAAAYGGGGHRLASGCTLAGDLAELKAGLVEDIETQLND